MTAAVEWIRDRLASGRLTIEQLAALVPFAQRELGVTDDGKPGPATLAAVRDEYPDVLAPIPGNRAEVLAAYGDPAWERTGKGRGVDIDDAWEHRNIRSYRLHTGRRVRMHRLAGSELVTLFERACELSGYTPKSGPQTYVPRVIGGTDRLSYHALGIAFDVDPRDNPWGGVRKDGSPSLLRQHMRFVEVFEVAGWTWGGRWRLPSALVGKPGYPATRKRGWGDDMHFQRGG